MRVVDNYHESNNSFPILIGVGADQSFWHGPSVLVYLLGYMEKGTLYNAFNFNAASVVGDIAANTSKNTTVTNANVNSFNCPSDVGASVFKQATNYVASVGPQFRYDSGTAGVGVGMFAVPRAFGVRDCIDGTSNTVAFGEALIGDNSAGMKNGAERYSNLPWPSNPNEGNGIDQVVPDSVNNLRTYITQCNAQKQAKTNEVNDAQSYWAAGRMHQGPIISMLTTPNSKNGDCAWYPAQAQMCAMRSRHSGGVNVCLADGSVRFIKDSISETTWWAIGTRNRGEVVSADSL